MLLLFSWYASPSPTPGLFRKGRILADYPDTGYPRIQLGRIGLDAPPLERPVAKSLYRTENLELAALLRSLREALGLTQTQFAARLKRNQTYVSNVELGIRRLDLVELRDYCVGLEIELAELIARWEARILPKSKTKGKTKR